MTRKQIEKLTELKATGNVVKHETTEVFINRRRYAVVLVTMKDGTILNINQSGGTGGVTSAISKRKN
jgi:hypothetical protein